MKNLLKLFILYAIGYFQIQIAYVTNVVLSRGDIIGFAIVNLLMMAIFLWKLPEKSLLAVCLIFFLRICGAGLMSQIKFMVALMLLAVMLVLTCLVLVSRENAKLVKEGDIYYELGDYPQCYQ